MFCGIIMGYYGNIWPIGVIKKYAYFCKKVGLDCFIYGPKKDEFLRDRYQENWPKTEFENLLDIRNVYGELKVEFGIAFSPVSVCSIDRNWEKSMIKRFEQINKLEIDVLVISFDDIDISLTGPCDKHLCGIQMQVADFIANISNAKKLYFTPSYYCYSGLILSALESSAENRTEYLSMLSNLDQKFNIFWTGSDVIPKGISVQEIEEINKVLNRKVTLWDNYPANDPCWMRQTIANIYPLTGRSHTLSQAVEGHFVNPMLQPYLSQISIASLLEIYKRGDQYSAQEVYEKLLDRYCSELKDFFITQNMSLVEISYAPGYKKAIKRIKEELVKVKTDSEIYNEINDWLDMLYKC